MERDGLEVLVDRLSKAAAKFSADERGGASDALDALCDYLRAVAPSAQVRMPLIALMAALGDLDRGITPEIVRPAPHRGGTQKPTFEAMDWAAAAAALTLAEEARLDRPLDLVARAAGVDKKALGEMRRNINREKAPANTIEHYEWFLAKARSYTELSERERAEAAIEHVRAGTNIR